MKGLKALWLIGLLSLIGLLPLQALCAASVTTGKTATTVLDGTPVQYYVPPTLPTTISANGKQLGAGTTKPLVIIANPNPAPTPIHIPAPAAIQAPIGRQTTPVSTFQITYVEAGNTDLWGSPCSAFPAQAKAAFAAATAIWANTLKSSVPIQINACWSSLAGNTLGYTGGGSFYRDFTHAKKANTWYLEPLANALAGEDLGTSTYDMHLTLNQNFAWYYGTDGNTPADKIDLMTVLLHEVTHGLGFNGLMTYTPANKQGNYGYSTGLPSIYDSLLQDGAGNALTDTGIYANPSLNLGAALTSNDLWFNGPISKGINGNQRVKLFAPTEWVAGSSYAHLDYTTFLNTRDNLMIYALGYGASIHDPGALTRGMLQDMGWSVANSTVPDPFSFSTKTDVALDSLIESDTITINNGSASMPISIQGGEYSLNDGRFTTATGTVKPGDRLKVRHKSANRELTTTQTSVTIAGITGTFTSTTLKLYVQITLQNPAYGTITSKPVGIVCGTKGTQCKASSGLSIGTSVTLTATPDEGYLFKEWWDWTGLCPNKTPTCTFTLNKTPAMLFAVFIPQPGFDLSINTSGAGTITSRPSGINCGSTCQKRFATNTLVTLTATPTSGNRFIGWSGACSGTAITCNVKINAAKTVTATFQAVFPLTASKTGKGSGSISSSIPGINCGSDCSETYPANTLVTLTAKPANDAVFKGWSGACSGTGSCQVTLTEAKTVSAQFDLLTYDLTVTKTGQGSITSAPTGIDCGSDCIEAYRPNTAVNLTAKAAAGYQFIGWSGACTGTKPSCAVTMRAAKNVNALFQPIFSLTLNKSGMGSGTITSTPTGISCGSDCTHDYLQHTIVTLSAKATKGSRFAGWSGACTGFSSCQVNMNTAKTITAAFMPL